MYLIIGVGCLQCPKTCQKDFLPYICLFQNPGTCICRVMDQDLREEILLKDTLGDTESETTLVEASKLRERALDHSYERVWNKILIIILWGIAMSGGSSRS